MSYCRFGSYSDLYVYESDAGFECCCCALRPDDNDRVVLSTPREMVSHVREHINAGHDVPDDVIPALLAAA